MNSDTEVNLDDRQGTTIEREMYIIEKRQFLGLEGTQVRHNYRVPIVIMCDDNDNGNTTTTTTTIATLETFPVHNARSTLIIILSRNPHALECCQ